MPGYRDGMLANLSPRVYGDNLGGKTKRIMGPDKKTSALQPATNLTQADIDLWHTRGTFENFHAAWNEHGRNTIAQQQWERNDYRTLERMAPFPNDKNVVESRRRRAASAPRARPATAGVATAQVPPGASMMDAMTTQTGLPIYTVEAIVDAELDSGTPVTDGLARPAWQVARVQTYKVPPSALGYGAGGTRPFHQDYRHYKYFGFAGRGAKTSWAHNPKMSEQDTGGSTNTAKAQAANVAAAGMPLHETIGGPSRRLTAIERLLVTQFRMHSLSAEGVPSGLGKQEKGGMMGSVQWQAAEGQRMMSASMMRSALTRSALPPAAIVEPYIETVDIIDRFQVDPQQPRSSTTDVARVATYRQPATMGYTQEENPSPNTGSQSPFHQRYSHYKMHGFAGKGATSSWARNPKLAMMNDHQ